jgi:hypothetical protein
MRTENESEDHRGGDSIETVEKYLCERVSRRYSGKPDHDKIVEARNYFRQGNAQIKIFFTSLNMFFSFKKRREHTEPGK